jgi:Domain of unknown function (DUF4288)
MWYAVGLLFKGVHVIEPPMTGIWEEVIILVDADDERGATESGQRMAKSKEHEYYVDAPAKHLLQWVFMQVERVHAIDEPILRSGTELFSRFLRQSEVESLLTPFEDVPVAPE